MKTKTYLLAALLTGTLVVSAQTPQPAPAGQAPPPGQGQGPGGPGGRGGGRGGGPPGGGNEGADFSPKPHVVPKTGAEEAKTFILPAGYRMELVASDPDIIMPTTIEFDGNGRMYVGEMRTYMMDADASRQYEPLSRISRWEDTNGDGTFDKHTTFADNLILPRMILPLDKDSILTN